MSMVFNLRRHQPRGVSRSRRALIDPSATGVFKEIEFPLVEALLIKAASRMSNLLTVFRRLAELAARTAHAARAATCS